MAGLRSRRHQAPRRRLPRGRGRAAHGWGRRDRVSAHRPSPIHRGGGPCRCCRASRRRSRGRRRPYRGSRRRRRFLGDRPRYPGSRRPHPFPVGRSHRRLLPHHRNRRRPIRASRYRHCRTPNPLPLVRFPTPRHRNRSLIRSRRRSPRRAVRPAIRWLDSRFRCAAVRRSSGQSSSTRGWPAAARRTFSRPLSSSVRPLRQ